MVLAIADVANVMAVGRASETIQTDSDGISVYTIGEHNGNANAS